MIFTLVQIATAEDEAEAAEDLKEEALVFGVEELIEEVANCLRLKEVDCVFFFPLVRGDVSCLGSLRSQKTSSRPKTSRGVCLV